MTTAPLRRVGRYLLGERLGSGGMGTVFAAVQTGPLGLTRPVAVKELHPHLARDADFVAMLLNEARVQGALEHPNVVPVLDAVAEGGELFVVLSPVDGLPLSQVAQRLRERDVRVPEAIAAGIACDVLEGLHAAHELRSPDGARAGVVHRDVSPHNVMLGRDGVARVLDFGIAKAVAHGQTTRDGVVKGKPSYMSPEQLAGESTDRRSDVFAAAVVVAELLMGRKLSASADTGEVRRFHERALQHPATWLREQGVDGAMAEALGRCLERDAADRPVSARASALAIDAACPRASAARVAEWLTEELGAELDERTAILARALAAATQVEHTEPTQPSVASGEDGEGRSSRPSQPSRPRSGGPGAPGRDAVSPRGRATGLVLAFAAVALATGGFVCGRAGGPAIPRTALAAADGPKGRAADAPASATPPAVAPPSPLAVAAPSPAVLTDPEPDRAPAAVGAGARRASPVPPPPPAPPATHASTGTTAATARHAAPSAAKPTQSCDPPYTVDSSGVRIFKSECL